MAFNLDCITPTEAIMLFGQHDCTSPLKSPWAIRAITSAASCGSPPTDFLISWLITYATLAPIKIASAVSEIIQISNELAISRVSIVVV